MENENLSKIKSEIQNIINKNRTTCLCGHGEWCESCNTSSNYNKLVRELNEYLNKLK